MIEDVLDKNLKIKNVDELNQNKFDPLTFIEYISLKRGIEL